MPKSKSVDIKINQLDVQTDIVIPGIKLKFLSAKKNDYGENNLFQVFGEKQLQYIFELAEENLKIPVWRYNDKCNLKVNGKGRSTCHRSI